MIQDSLLIAQTVITILPGGGGGSHRGGGLVKILQAITFTFLDWRLINRSWPSPGASRGLCYWYSNVLTVKYYFHKTRCDSNILITCELSPVFTGGDSSPVCGHVAVHRNPQTRVHKYRGPPPKRKSYRYLKDLLLYSFLWVISPPRFDIVVKP